MKLRESVNSIKDKKTNCLTLCNNKIGDEGVKALADAGRHNFHPTTAGQEIALTGDQDDYPN